MLTKELQSPIPLSGRRQSSGLLYLFDEEIIVI
jgi:hypothetical protein